MRIMRGSSVILLVVGLLHLCCGSSSTSSFKWSDCGVQLNKALHYQSASISPQLASQNGPLSINVQATVSDTIYNAQTRLMVWKDGEVYLDVFIDDLCSILANTKGMSCPLYVGQVSFTYEFASVPALPSGNYKVDIRSYVGSAGETDTDEIGCIEFKGNLDGVDGSNCQYNSNFQVKLKGDAVYSNSDRTARLPGDWLQIGPIGKISNPSAYGTFAEDYMGTPDVGGRISSSGYTWALNGTLVSRTNFTSSQRTVDLYSGTFYVLYGGAINMKGYFNWTFDYNPSTGETVTGLMWLDPEYYFLAQFSWPTTISNLGPFTMQTQADGTFTVSGAQQYCTCGVDECGVCNGDGRTCDFGRNKHGGGDDWGPRKKAAVACGVIGFLLIILVAELSRRVRKERRKIPIDDNDLVDHPEKPDYGTMAIDDAIREGERVV